MTPEFSHCLKLSELGLDSEAQSIAADGDQRKELAKRFDLPVIESLEARYDLVANGNRIKFTGIINATLEQSCAISGEAIPVIVEEPFEIVFVPKTEATSSEDEIELAAEDCDIIEYEGGKIDIGEAIAQTLYLSLDPFPRGPNADEIARKQGLQSEEEAGPFGALAALKDKLD